MAPPIAAANEDCESLRDAVVISVGITSDEVFGWVHVGQIKCKSCGITNPKLSVQLSLT